MKQCQYYLAGMILLGCSITSYGEELKPQSFSNARKLSDAESEGPFRFGVGYAFFGNFLNENQIGSFSFLFDFTPTHSLQVFGGVGTVREYFNFGSGLIYRGTVAGNRSFGLHLGAIAQVGILGSEDFYGELGPIMGLHSSVFGFSRLQLSLDGGVMVQYRNDQTNVLVGPVGNGMFGLSIHYFL